MFMHCIPIPNQQCVCATAPFPRDEARKKLLKDPLVRPALSKVFTRHQKTIKQGRVKKQLTIEVKKQHTLGR